MTMLSSALLAAGGLYVAAGLAMSRDLWASPHRAAWVLKFGWFNVLVTPVALFPVGFLYSLLPRAEGPTSDQTLVFRHAGTPHLARSLLYDNPVAVTPAFSALGLGDQWTEMVLGDATGGKPGIVQMFALARTPDDTVWTLTPKRFSTLTRGIHKVVLDFRAPGHTRVTFSASTGTVEAALCTYLRFVNDHVDGITAAFEDPKTSS